MRTYLVVKDKITIGRFQKKEDALKALKEYITNGYITEEER